MLTYEISIIGFSGTGLWEEWIVRAPSINRAIALAPKELRDQLDKIGCTHGEFKIQVVCPKCLDPNCEGTAQGTMCDEEDWDEDEDWEDENAWEDDDTEEDSR